MILYVLTAHQSRTVKSSKGTFMNHKGIFRTPWAITLAASVPTYHKTHLIPEKHKFLYFLLSSTEHVI